MPPLATSGGPKYDSDYFIKPTTSHKDFCKRMEPCNISKNQLGFSKIKSNDITISKFVNIVNFFNFYLKNSFFFFFLLFGGFNKLQPRTKYFWKGKKIKQNWTRPGNFNICFSIIFQR